MATPPRHARPGTTMLTRRCLERRFFLRPDPVMDEAYVYLLGAGKERYDLDLHGFSFLPNHYHIFTTDPTGRRRSDFLQWFNACIARLGNAGLGRRDHFWDSSKASIVWIPPRQEDLVEKLAYVICNPVSSQLVRTSKQWPGVVSLASDIGSGKVFRARRPAFFDDDGDLPDEVAFQLTPPPAMDASPDEIQLAARQRCNEVEAEIQRRVEASGGRFLGAKRCRRVNPHDSPSTPDHWFGLSPHLACKDPDLRVHLLGILKGFRREYQEKRVAFCSGDRDVVFPPATLKMVNLYGCTCRPIAEIDIFDFSYG
ncbi:MAG: hypothetical protein AAF488_11840 [Planctomycetota bacterium]